MNLKPLPFGIDATVYYQEKYESSAVASYVKAFLYAKQDIVWFSINKEIKLERIPVFINLSLLCNQELPIIIKTF